MAEHEFTLIFRGFDNFDNDIDRDFAENVDDGLAISQYGVPYVELFEEAPTFEAAVLAAIARAESAGFLVARVGPDPIVSVQMIADRISQPQALVDQWSRGATGPGDFPRHLDSSPDRTWYWSDVVQWLSRSSEASPPPATENSRFIGRINGLLRFRGDEAIPLQTLLRRLQ